MKLHTEPVFEAALGAKNPAPVKRMVSVDFPMDCVSPTHKDVQIQKSAVQTTNARIVHLWVVSASACSSGDQAFHAEPSAN